MIAIRVPATSANIGPGFDALGVALRLYDEFTVEESDRVEVLGCASEYSGSDNLFVRAYRGAHDELGLPLRGVRVRVDAAIPLARGLGSSAAMIVGGAAAAAVDAATAAGRGPLGYDRDFILDFAARMEGHPDNAAPAVMGGFCAAILSAAAPRHSRPPREFPGVPVSAHARPRVARFSVDETLVFHALVPPFELSTAAARAALPPSLPLKDAAFNAGRAAMVACAFAGRDYSLLRDACEDRIHQPWRAPLIPGYDEVMRACRESGALAVWLSGAGPTIMALTAAPAVAAGIGAGDYAESGSASGFAQAIASVLAARPEGAWRHIALAPDNDGLRIVSHAAP